MTVTNQQVVDSIKSLISMDLLDDYHELSEVEIEKFSKLTYNRFKVAFKNEDILKWIKIIPKIQRIYDGDENILQYEPNTEHWETRGLIKRFISRPKNKIYCIYVEICRIYDKNGIDSITAIKFLQKIDLSFKTLHSLISLVYDSIDWLLNLIPRDINLIAKAMNSLLTYTFYQEWVKTGEDLPTIVKLRRTSWKADPSLYLQVKNTKKFTKEQLFNIGNKSYRVSEFFFEELSKFLNETGTDLNEALNFTYVFGFDSILFKTLKEIPLNHDEIKGIFNYFFYTYTLNKSEREIALKQEIQIYNYDCGSFKDFIMDGKINKVLEVFALWNTKLIERNIDQKEIQEFWTDVYAGKLRGLILIEEILPFTNKDFSLINIVKIIIQYKRYNEYYSQIKRSSLKELKELKEVINYLNNIYDYNEELDIASLHIEIKDFISSLDAKVDVKEVKRIKKKSGYDIHTYIEIQKRLKEKWGLDLSILELEQIISDNDWEGLDYYYPREILTYKVMELKGNTKNIIHYFMYQGGNINVILEKRRFREQIIAYSSFSRSSHFDDANKTVLLKNEEDIENIMDLIIEIYKTWIGELGITPRDVPSFYRTFSDINEAKKWISEYFYDTERIRYFRKHGITPKNARLMMERDIQRYVVLFGLTIEDAEKVRKIIPDLSLPSFDEATIEYLEKEGLETDIIEKIVEIISDKYPQKQMWK
jgi:hypothetical protein